MNPRNNHLLRVAILLAALATTTPAHALEATANGLQGPQAVVDSLNTKFAAYQAATQAVFNAILTCAKKGMFHDPSHTNPSPDADGCYNKTDAFFNRTWHETTCRRGVWVTNDRDYPIEVNFYGQGVGTKSAAMLFIRNPGDTTSAGMRIVDQTLNDWGTDVVGTVPPHGQFSVSSGDVDSGNPSPCFLLY